MITKIKNLFNDKPSNIQRDWDMQRKQALSPNELSEINAIFSRYVDDWA